MGQTAGAGNLFEECLVSVVAAAVVAAIPIVADGLLSFVVVSAIAGSFLSFVVVVVAIPAIAVSLLLCRCCSIAVVAVIVAVISCSSWFVFSFIHSVSESSSSLWSLSPPRHYSAFVGPVVLYLLFFYSFSLAVSETFCVSVVELLTGCRL